MPHAPATAVPTMHAAETANTSLRALLDSDAQALEQLYARARWQGEPRLTGHPRGHVLAVPGADRGLLRGVVRAATRGPFNPWQGKSFRAEGGADAGSGTNRVGFGRFGSAFTFKTYVGPSVVDGAPAFVIDYDVPSNPAYARRTVDELRPVGAGLLLGRGMARRKGREPRVLLWFALDEAQQDRAVDW